MKACIFGAGQAGRMALNWLPADVEVLSFIDNSPEKQKSLIDSKKVLPLEDALQLEPGEIILAVINHQSEKSISQQIRASGFPGEIISINEIRKVQDLRLASLRMIAERIREYDIKGDTAELGVYKGAFARQINLLFPDRTLVLLDTFSGFPLKDMEQETIVSGQTSFQDFSDTSEKAVRTVLRYPERAEFVKGTFPESTIRMKERTYAFVSIDPDLYAPAAAGLAYFWPRMSAGGMIMIHDDASLQYPGVHQAVKEFVKKTGAVPVPLMDMHGTSVLVKQRS